MMTFPRTFRLPLVLLLSLLAWPGGESLGADDSEAPSEGGEDASEGETADDESEASQEGSEDVAEPGSAQEPSPAVEPETGPTEQPSGEEGQAGSSELEPEEEGPAGTGLGAETAGTTETEGSESGTLVLAEGPSVAALRLLGVALDRLVLLEAWMDAKVQGESEAEGAASKPKGRSRRAARETEAAEAARREEALRLRGDLAAAKEALRDALVEVGRLQEEESLRAWLEGEGLAQRIEQALANVEAKKVAAAEAERSEAVLSDQDLRGIRRAVEAAPFKDGKMRILTRELAVERVTSTQAAELLDLFNFSRDRVDALVYLHPRIVDAENFEHLLSSLKFESDRVAVRSQLGLDDS